MPLGDGQRPADIRQDMQAQRSRRAAEAPRQDNSNGIPAEPAASEKKEEGGRKVIASISKNGGLSVGTTVGPVSISWSPKGFKAKPNFKKEKPVQRDPEYKMGPGEPFTPGEGGRGMLKNIEEANASTEAAPLLHVKGNIFIGAGKLKKEKSIEFGTKGSGDARDGYISNELGKKTKVAGATITTTVNAKKGAEALTVRTAGELTRAVVNSDMGKKVEFGVRKRALDDAIDRAENP
jgi:hypothetical protein